MTRQIKLHGRVFVNFEIEAVTGLHIGGTETGIEIGGVDKTVIRNPLNNRPYIPGSSLKGKMRSLLEKYHGKRQNQRIGQGYIHSCDQADEYSDCAVCQVFGVPGERNFATPTRLVVRDTALDPQTAKKLEESGRTTLPYTEVKTEVSIDRVTSAANPRQMERVPAGAIFSDGEIVYSLYQGDGCSLEADIQRFATILEGMQLLEDDYLGGLGSRGSGKVRFQGIKLLCRSQAAGEAVQLGKYDGLGALVADLANLKANIQKSVAA